MRRLVGLGTLAAVIGGGLAVPAAPVFAQDRINEIVVYGNDPCPRSTEDEVVVCARKPEAERYRIPEPYRPVGTRQQTQSWANRAKAIEYVGRTGTMSCSPVGPGGYTGCLSKLIREAKEEAAENRAAETPPQQ